MPDLKSIVVKSISTRPMAYGDDYQRLAKFLKANAFTELSSDTMVSKYNFSKDMSQRDILYFGAV